MKRDRPRAAPSGSLERRLTARTVAGLAIVAVIAAGAATVLFRLLPFGAAATSTVAVVGLVVAGLGVAQRRSIWRALAPVREIERTLGAAEAGDLRARARADGTADAALAGAVAGLNRLLAAQLADRQRLRDVAARAFRAQEAERLRVARELQEETAQTLTTVLFRLRAARAAAGSERDAQLDEVRDELMRTTDSLRGFARALHPPSLKDLGLVPALEGYARSLAGSSGLQIQIVADDVAGVLSVEGELALYRIVQEALANVVRHARAGHVLVRVRNAGGDVLTLVEDDGRGFPIGETEARLPCLGLFGMRERALSVGGTVEIDSIPEDGTRVRISIPATSHAGAARTAPWPVILRPNDAPAAGEAGAAGRAPPAV